MQNRFSIAFVIILSLTFSVAANAWITVPKLIAFVRQKGIDSPREKLALMISMYAYHKVGWDVVQDGDSDLSSYFGWHAIQSDIGIAVSDTYWDAAWTHSGSAAIRATRDRSWKTVMNEAYDAVWQVAYSRAYDVNWGQPRDAYLRGALDIQMGTKNFREAEESVRDYLSNNSALTLEVTYTEALETLPARLEHNPFESTKAWSHFREMRWFPPSVFLLPWLTVLDLLGSDGPLPENACAYPLLSNLPRHASTTHNLKKPPIWPEMPIFDDQQSSYLEPTYLDDDQLVHMNEEEKKPQRHQARL